MTTSGAADYRFLPIRVSSIVAVMSGLAPAAGMLRRDGSLQRDGKNGPEKREQKQESCGQTLHCFPVKQNPKLG